MKANRKRPAGSILRLHPTLAEITGDGSPTYLRRLAEKLSFWCRQLTSTTSVKLDPDLQEHARGFSSLERFMLAYKLYRNVQQLTALAEVAEQSGTG